MDSKTIEQLLERYWQCETSLAEEEILRAFFSQDSVPPHLRKYAPLFSYCRGQKEAQGLGDDFDSRILAMTEDKPAPVKARTVTLGRRLMPLFRAAAVVAIVLTIGNAAYMAVGDRSGGRDDINYANYKDTFTDPAVAYDEVESALQLVTEGISSADTTSSATPGGAQTPARR